MVKKLHPLLQNMMMGRNFTMHVGFQNAMFYNEMVKGVKVLWCLSALG
jgi:hypothetical protein